MLLHCYYQPTRGMSDQTWLLNLWQLAWKKAGHETRVLTEKDAASHPGFEYYEKKISAYPTTNPPDYERACFLRHMAMANTPGAQFLLDYDVMPNPKGKPFALPLAAGIMCLEPTRVPCAMYGTQAGYEDVCDFLSEYDAEGQKHVSDMTIIRKTAIPVADPPICVEYQCSGRNIENDPGHGWKEAPWIHFSTFSFAKKGWIGDKATLIRRALTTL